MPTPSLFDAPQVCRPALDELASRSMSPEQLRADYVSVAKSGDLFDLGYTIIHWIKPGDPKAEVIEYRPRFSDFPRVTITDYVDQVKVHEAIGAKVVGRGRDFHAKGGR